MIEQTDLGVSLETLSQDIETLLSHLGEGQVFSVPYDTGWLARLSAKFPTQEFDRAYEWLRTHQHTDGSWGGDIRHYHDRIVCTLSAAIALYQNTHPAPIDDMRVKQAISYVWQAIDHLHVDANDTINFRGIASLLLAEANEMGLEVPQNIYYKHDKSGGKIAKLRQHPEIWRQHPISYSLECLHPTLPELAGLIEENGAIGTSPAATAALLLNSTEVDERALNYLRITTRADGGLPTVSPIDTFEITWSLNLLRLNNAATPDHPMVKARLDHVWNYWNAETGGSFSSFFPATNLDDTANAFVVLHWAGYPVDAAVFRYYEEDSYFRCYPDETDPSLSAHLRLLMALKMQPDYPQTNAWIAKILTFLQAYVEANKRWTDKWHSSPFYLRSLAVIALHGIQDDLAYEHLRWITKTQRPDGGWGFYGRSTPEETAYALHALLYWHRHATPLDMLQIQQGTRFLMRHFHDKHTPLWIGKCLYTPALVVQAAVLAALYNYQIL